MSLVCLAVEANPRAAENPVVGGHSVIGESLQPPIITRIYKVLMRNVGRLEPSAKLRFDLFDAVRTRHRREARLEQLVVLEALPIAPAGADRDIGGARPQIN